MSRTYRMAIIGVGGIAQLHARAIQDLPNAQLIAGSCRTPDKGQAFAKQWSCQWFPDYQAMLDEVKPDVVTIATPSGAHLEPLLACAQRGIHVICEKPIEINVDRIQQMLDAAASAQIMLGGIFPLRFKPANQVLHQAMAQGRFGKSFVISVAVPWWRDDAYYAPNRWQGTLALDGGGALMNQSIHLVDQLQWLTAAASPDSDPHANPVQDVFCLTGKLGHDPSLIEVEDTALAVARLRSGSLAQVLAATSMYPGTQTSITVSSREGAVQIVGEQITLWQFRDERPEDDQIRQRFAQPTQHSGGASDPLAIPYQPHRDNFAQFLDALDHGRPPAIDGPEAAKAVAIVQACYESAASGQPVQPPRVRTPADTPSR
ncbi:MAG TPA: Gfo/Idh/MocA family oxidoreductase [Phycisphaeraceae bacterium]